MYPVDGKAQIMHLFRQVVDTKEEEQMAAHRLPLKVLEGRGSFKINPSRRKGRENEVVVDKPLGPCPKHLNADVRKAWQRIVSTAPPEALTAADEMAVELASRMWVDYDTLGSRYDAAKLGRLISLLAAFGMTPSDRAKLQIAKPDNGKKDKPNRFAPDED